MVDEIRHLEHPPRAVWRHDEWRTYDEYQLIHDRRLEELSNRGYVLGGRLEWDPPPPRGAAVNPLHVYGRIACAHDTVVEVEKFLDAQWHGPLRVRGCLYRYHAWRMVNNEALYLVRYDCSAHFEDAQLAADLSYLHRHIFDDQGEAITEERIELPDLPNMHQIIEYTVERTARILAA